jgi:hypothetical protein
VAGALPAGSASLRAPRGSSRRANIDAENPHTTATIASTAPLAMKGAVGPTLSNSSPETVGPLATPSCSTTMNEESISARRISGAWLTSVAFHVGSDTA